MPGPSVFEPLLVLMNTMEKRLDRYAGSGYWPKSVPPLTQTISIKLPAAIIEASKNCSYGHQKGDGAPTISAEEQKQQTADAVATWIKQES